MPDAAPADAGNTPAPAGNTPQDAAGGSPAGDQQSTGTTPPVSAPKGVTGFGGASLPNPEPKGFGGQDVNQPAADQTKPQASVDPKSYANFTVPAHVDQTTEHFSGMMEAFRSEAAQRGMSQEAAQGVMDMIHALDAKAQEGAQAQVQAQQEAWETEAKAQGLWSQEALNAANAGLLAADPKGELREMFQSAGLLSHPGLITAFGAVHSLRTNPAVVRAAGGVPGGLPQQPTNANPLANALYGS